MARQNIEAWYPRDIPLGWLLLGTDSVDTSISLANQV